MTHIDSILPCSIEDMQQGLAGQWGQGVDTDALQEIAAGQLNFRLIFGTREAVPQAARSGYVKTLAILAFDDGTSAVETLDAPRTFQKSIKMGVMIARQEQ